MSSDINEWVAEQIVALKAERDEAEARALAAEKELERVRQEWRDAAPGLRDFKLEATRYREALEAAIDFTVECGDRGEWGPRDPVRSPVTALSRIQAVIRAALSQVEPASPPDTPNTDHLSRQGRVCPECEGDGRIAILDTGRAYDAGISDPTVECRRCEGAGKVEPATCPKCLGEPDGWWCEACKNTGRVDG